MTAFLKRHWLTALFVVLSIGFMFAAWGISWSVNNRNELIVPSIGRTLTQFFKLFAEAEFWKALGMTFARTVMAVGVSFVLAVLCTLLGLVYAPFKAFVSPVIAVCRTVPTMAVTLVIMLTFKTVTPVVVTTLVVFPMFYAQLTAAVDGVDRGLLEMAKAYGVKKRTVVAKIIIPQIAPVIVMQLGTVLSFALKLTISAEVLAYVGNGIGEMIKSANFATEIARLAALTLASVVVGLLIEALFFVITKYSFKWKRNAFNQKFDKKI